MTDEFLKSELEKLYTELQHLKELNDEKLNGAVNAFGLALDNVHARIDEINENISRLFNRLEIIFAGIGLLIVAVQFISLLKN